MSVTLGALVDQGTMSITSGWLSVIEFAIFWSRTVCRSRRRHDEAARPFSDRRQRS